MVPTFRLWFSDPTVFQEFGGGGGSRGFFHFPFGRILAALYGGSQFSSARGRRAMQEDNKEENVKMSSKMPNLAFYRDFGSLLQ